MLVHRRPLVCDHIRDAITRCVGAAKGERQGATRFIDDPTGHLLLFAAHVVSTGAVVAAGETTARKLTNFDRRFPINTQAFDLA